MGQEMQLFEGKSYSLDHLRGMELDETTKALMGGGSQGKRISIRGSVFRMIVDGKEIAKNDNRSMNLVIVAAETNVSRKFYGSEYTEGDSNKPTCFSHDGRKPSDESEEKQSKLCATCPKNVKGSGKNGGRACGFHQRVAVVLENDMGGDVYQLNLPSMSIFGDNKDGKMTMQGYANLLGSHGLPITAVVTEARFDTDASVPKLTFKALRPLTADEIVITREQGLSEDAQKAISTDPAVLDGAGAKPAVAQDDEEFETAAPAPKKEAAAEPTKRKAKAAPKPEPAPAEIDLSEVDDILDEKLGDLDDWDD